MATYTPLIRICLCFGLALGLVLAGACSSDDPMPALSGDTSTTVTAAADSRVEDSSATDPAANPSAVGGPADSDPSADTAAPSTAAPTIVEAQPEPTTAVPAISAVPIDELVLAAEIEEFGHPLMADLWIDLADGFVPAVRLVGPDGTAHDVRIATDAVATQPVLLAGMRADTTYAVEVDVLNSDTGEVAGTFNELSLTTGQLPDGLPDMAVTVSDPTRMAPGLTMFNLVDLRGDLSSTESDPGVPPPPAGWIVAVDAAGEVVWYHHENHPIGDVRMLGDGTILFEFNDTAARRINLRGEVLEEWAGTIITGRFALDAHGRQVVGDDPVIVNIDSMHHEHNPLPDGTHATLSTELRVLDGFDEPQCGEDPDTFDGTYHLIGDVVVIFDPATGEVLEEFNLFDYFDPRHDPAAYNLCGLPFDFVFPNWLYKGVDNQARDWTHANAIELDEANNTLLVSIRHFDAVIALRWKDDLSGPAGELLWHSGPLGDLELLSGDWHLHQHAPEVLADGTVLLYDNGNNREGRGTPDAPLYSRAVRFAIDAAAGTIDQIWEYRSNRNGEPVYGAFVGDVDALANGNVLVTDGGVNGTRGDGLSAQIVEIVPGPGADGDEVFRLEVLGDAGWVVYRSERVPSIHGPA